MGRMSRLKNARRAALDKVPIIGEDTRSDQPCNYKPLQDFVLIEVFEGGETSQGGILIPESARKNFDMKFVVKAVGPGRRDQNGNLIPVAVKPGDVVILGPTGGIFELPNYKKQTGIVQEAAIFAIVPQEAPLVTAD